MVDNQDKFVSELSEMSSNNTLFTRDKYINLLEDVKQVKENTEMIGKDRNLLKQYGVLQETKLSVKTMTQSPIKNCSF